MPRIRLTKSAIDALPTSKSDVVYWDAGCPGFGVKVTPKGRKVFIVLYRTGGAATPMLWVVNENRHKTLFKRLPPVALPCLPCFEHVNNISHLPKARSHSRRQLFANAAIAPSRASGTRLDTIIYRDFRLLLLR